jgi:hypothetical protein
LQEVWSRAVEAVLVGANEMRYRQGRASSSRPLRRRAAGYNRPTRARTSNCSVRGLSRTRRTQRRLHGDIEISIVGLQHADRYISVVNTDTAQWSRPDLCLVAGLGVVAVEERALVGSCDRRTAVGRRDYAVIITLLWLGPRAASPRATTGANVHTVGKGAKPTIASTRSGQ